MDGDEHFFVPGTGAWITLAEDGGWYGETGEPLDVPDDVLLQDEDGSETTAGDELEMFEALEPLDADDLTEAAHEGLREQAQWYRQQQQDLMERQARRYEDEAREAQLEDAFEQELEERALGEAEGERRLRTVFQRQRSDWEEAHGFPFTQAEAARHWEAFRDARSADPRASFADVVSDDVEGQHSYVPDTTRDPLARRERMAAFMEEADEEAEREEAMELEPVESNARDAGERQHALADALRSGLTKVEAENRIAATGDRHAYSMKKTGETDPEGEPLYEVVEAAA